MVLAFWQPIPGHVFARRGWQTRIATPPDLTPSGAKGDPGDSANRLGGSGAFEVARQNGDGGPAGAGQRGLGERSRSALIALRSLLVRLAALAAAFWRLAKPLLKGLAQILLGLIIIFEEWGWRPLAALLGRLARYKL